MSLNGPIQNDTNPQENNVSKLPSVPVYQTQDQKNEEF